MRRLLLLACLFAPVPAFAVDVPAPGPRDSRVRIVTYDPLQVVQVCSTNLTPVTLILEEGEHAGMIAGLMVDQDEKTAKDWYIKAAGNMISLQPLREMDKQPSVLSIGGITADKQLRPYQIQLCTRNGNIAEAQADTQAYMAVQFHYQAARSAPDGAALAAAAARREAARQAAEDRAARVRLASATEGAPRNYAYDKRDPQGCPILAPTYVWDDGIRTTLTFPPHATVPAVYVLNQDGKEAVQTVINSDTPGGLEVMLPTVYRYIRLRRGGKVCELRNNTFDPYGQQPGGGTGTISPDVALVARTAR